MTKITVFSGFLGAGKTTLIKKLISELYKDEKPVLIENEFGEIGIDSGFMQDSGVQVTEINQGCICCTLVGDFSKALQQVIDEYSPARILIEPSGVGKLSDIINAVKNSGVNAELDGCIAVADANKCKVYSRNFGEFYKDQIENADVILLSRTETISEDKLISATQLLRELNATAPIVTTPWDKISKPELQDLIAGKRSELINYTPEHDEHCTCHEHSHKHDEHCTCHEHNHEHDEHCTCHEHSHEHDEHCTCHEHNHEHDEHCTCHEHSHEHDEHCTCHEHNHEHDEHCTCHEHSHEHDEHCTCHEHNHAADEIFASWGQETPKAYTSPQIKNILSALDSGEYGTILRAKGIVCSSNDTWIHFDYVPEEVNIRTGTPSYTGRICVIGSNLNTAKLEELFCIH